MRWDRLFDDLENQLASEWEAERAALDAESERLRISRVDLRGRLRMLCAAQATVRLSILGAARDSVRLVALGADWVAVCPLPDHAAHAARSMRIVPLRAIRAIAPDHGQLLASLDERDDEAPGLRERMTLGFVVRDLARRRVPVRIGLSDGEDLHGTIDRAGADHLDLAEHDAGQARLARSVSGFRIIPFEAITAVQIGADQLR